MSEEMKNQVEATEAVKAAVEEEPSDMASLLAQYDAAQEDFSRGKVIEGTVVSKVDGGWLVDVGYKCEGFLPEREWTHHVLVDDKPAPEVGDKIDVQIASKRDGEEAQLVVNRWRYSFLTADNLCSRKKLLIYL